MPRRLAQSKDLGVSRWIGFPDGLVEPSADYFPFNDNDGPDGNLFKLKRTSRLRQGLSP